GGLVANGGLRVAASLGVFGQHPERVHVDIPVRAVLGTDSAANTPVLDLDLDGFAPPNGPHRTSDHAQRVPALTAGGRHQVLVVAQAFAHETGDAVVGISTGLHTQIAAGAAVEIEEEEALCLHQPLLEELFDIDVGRERLLLAALLTSAGGLLGELASDRRVALEHQVEVIRADPDQLDVIDRRAGGVARLAAEQGRLTDEVATAVVREHQVASLEVLAHLPEPEAHQIEAVGRLSLPTDHLPGCERHQLHPPTEMFDEVRAEIGENRDATEVGFERTRPVCRIHLGPEALRAEQDLQDRA